MNIANIHQILDVMWDMMLAVVPVLLAYAMARVGRMNAPKLVRYGLLGIIAPVWFVFLPNTCYLLTEWRHFLFDLDSNNLLVHSRSNAAFYIPLIKGALFFACFSGFGMINFALAVRPVKRLAAKAGASISFWSVPFFALIALGVYLGLVLRFNSWDFLISSKAIWSASVDAFTRPRLAWFILCFGGFLWLAYEALDIWIDGMLIRFRGRAIERA